MEETNTEIKAEEVIKKKKKKKKAKEVRPVGRPLTWTSPDVLKKLVDNYFESEKQPTLAGLAVALDISRSTLYNYEGKDEFLDIVKKARERVERVYENILVYGGQPTGVIFALKNMGWADRQDIDHKSGGEKINIGVVSYDKVKEDAGSDNSP